MLRQVKIALATFAGMLSAGVLLVIGEFTDPRDDYGVNFMTGQPFTPWEWARGVIVLDLPIAGIVLLTSLALLELVQPRIKAPRLLFFVLGAMAFAALIGGVLSFAVAAFFSFNPPLFERVFGFDTPQDMAGGLFALPALLASVVYVWLTKDTKPGAPDPLPEEQFVAPAIVSDPQSASGSQRVLGILTSPRHRIGQRQFLAAVRTWSLAASLWWGVTALLMMWVGFDRELAFTIAASGWLILLWMAFCAIANRLHDFNLNGLLALGPVFAAFAWALSEPPPADGWASGPGLARCIIACVFCFGATAAVLLLQKGEPYSNQYGPESE